MFGALDFLIGANKGCDVLSFIDLLKLILNIGII
jgi:hypothetical protein